MTTALATVRWYAPVFTAIAVAALLAGCGSTGSGAASAAGTEQVRVTPVTNAGVPVRGFRVTAHAAHASCEPGSEAIGRAYRCFAGNYVYDPCWPEKAAAPTVLCVGEPWQRTEAELRLSAPLASLGPTVAGAGRAEPWGVRLAGGQRCLLVQGAHSVFRGTVIDYFCSDTLLLLRGLDMAAHTWTAHSVLDKSGTLRAGPAEKIDVAWYGVPAH